jgi:hypothetical protein
MGQQGRKSVASTHPSPAAYFQRRDEWNGRCVFKPNGKCYDTAMNVVVVLSMVNCHEGNVERPICVEGQLRVEGSIVDPVGDDTLHTLIVALPEEEQSHEIPYRLPHLQH